MQSGCRSNHSDDKKQQQTSECTQILDKANSPNIWQFSFYSLASPWQETIQTGWKLDLQPKTLNFDPLPGPHHVVWYSLVMFDKCSKLFPLTTQTQRGATDFLHCTVLLWAVIFGRLAELRGLLGWDIFQLISLMKCDPFLC